jgi:hypothetical protein
MAVQRFRLSVVPHSRIDRSHILTMSPKYGMPMTLERHNGQFEVTPITGNLCEMVDLTRSDATLHPMTIKMPELKAPARRKLAA